MESATLQLDRIALSPLLTLKELTCSIACRNQQACRLEILCPRYAQDLYAMTPARISGLHLSL